MKTRILFLSTLAFALSGCGGYDSPKAVLNTLYQSLVKNDYALYQSTIASSAGAGMGSQAAFEFLKKQIPESKKDIKVGKPVQTSMTNWINDKAVSIHSITVQTPSRRAVFGVKCDESRSWTEGTVGSCIGVGSAENPCIDLGGVPHWNFFRVCKVQSVSFSKSLRD